MNKFHKDIDIVTQVDHMVRRAVIRTNGHDDRFETITKAFWADLLVEFTKFWGLGEFNRSDVIAADSMGVLVYTLTRGIREHEEALFLTAYEMFGSDE